MNYVIITGVSRGIGEALCLQFASPEHSVIGVSRTDNRDLEAHMLEKGARFKLSQIDLSDVEHAEDWEHEIFAGLELEEGDTITLYNNAGTLQPMKHIENASYSEIIKSYDVNTLAPILLTSAFIKKTESFSGEKRIITISSGAALHPYEGWACYSSTKAAMNMFTQCVGLEQKNKTNPVKITAIAPGIIDTQMQDEIRATESNDFGMVGKFIELKETGSLKSPTEVAEKLATLVNGTTFKDGQIMDISEL